MNTYSVLRTKAVLALALATSAGATGLFAQAQSLLSSNQVVITRVENVNPTTILISGINFDKFNKAAPVVSLSGAGTAVTTIPSTYNVQNKDITALIPASVASIPGSYRLMVSFGSGTAGTDVFEFTVGAVGPKGEKGEKGDKGDRGEKGDKGDKGDTGIQGPQGEQGLVGPQGAQGIQGIQGVQGEKGDKGDKGNKGDQGDKGDTGAVGPQGPQGLRGETGAQGLTGAPGKSGNFPLFRNEADAVAAGLRVGDIWVQDQSGQMFQITKISAGQL